MKQKNYRYDTICLNCGKYIKKDEASKKKHKGCKPRLKGSKFLCGVCGVYKTYENFGRDKNKKYGIRHNCNDCRRKMDKINRRLRIK